MSCCAAAIPFSGSRMDRADHVRADPERLKQFMVPTAKLLKLDGLAPVLDDRGQLAWGKLADAPADSELVFLGIMNGYGCFAAVPEKGNDLPAYMQKTWGYIAVMSDADMAIYGEARSLVDWHARHRFCAVCGQPSVLAKAGWQRNCSDEACGAQHFPRTDPVTIMLVEHSDRLLLGRGLRFPPGRFSALAGFVEPGETIEEAVAREVLEEAGVRVRDVSYMASQAWPFPSQLMIGCHAYAVNDELRIDTTELAEAHWYTREQVTEALEKGDQSPTFLPPPRQAIANHMLRRWVERV